MPKLKTHSGAKKRFKLTKTGKVKRATHSKSHILTKKDHQAHPWSAQQAATPTHQRRRPSAR